MIVWIATYEEHYEYTKVLGVFWQRDSAEKACEAAMRVGAFEATRTDTKTTWGDRSVTWTAEQHQVKRSASRDPQEGQRRVTTEDLDLSLELAEVKCIAHREASLARACSRSHLWRGDNATHEDGTTAPVGCEPRGTRQSG